jgi:hypothetical protein
MCDQDHEPAIAKILPFVLYLMRRYCFAVRTACASRIYPSFKENVGLALRARGWEAYGVDPANPNP